MWIRTQDKTQLLNVDKIVIGIKNQTGKELDITQNTLHGIYIDCYTELGTYKTKERALEVLDEIEEALINGKMSLALVNGLGLSTDKSFNDEIKEYIKDALVYQMPKE